MNTPLNRLFSGLVAALALTCLTSQGYSQTASGTGTVVADDASSSASEAPSDSRDPLATGLGGGAMSSGPAGDVVKGGDSGGQDLPPDLGGGGNGGSGGDDDDTDGDGAEDDDSPTRDPAGSARMVMVIRVSVASPDGVVVRIVRLAVGPHGARSATALSTARHASQGAH